MQNNNTSNSMDWFDLSDLGIYITPELICGKPCILLLDAGLLFSKNNLYINKIEQHQFEPITFEFSQGLGKHLYILFTESISNDFFHKQLGLPGKKIKKFSAHLTDIQKLFYENARAIYNFRIDVLIKSSKFLGFNHQGHDVYNSRFGRYKVSLTGSEHNERVHTTEPSFERNLSFLRAITPEDVFYCSEGYVRSCIQKNRNLSIHDVINYASTLFEPIGHEGEFSARPYQILIVLNVFSAVYVKHSLINVDQSQPDILNSTDAYRQVCLVSETAPSSPRGIFTDYLANQLNTPLPIAFIMQKLLINGDSKEPSDCSVLNSMFGYGTLSFFLAQSGFNVTGLEINERKIQLINAIKYSNIKLHASDVVNDDLSDFKSNGAPWSYVISSPACYKNSKLYEFNDGNGCYTTDRSDLISIIKSLSNREDAGRSVYLIPYFLDPNVQYPISQDADLEAFIRFIGSRYEIEGGCRISAEIYSKSLENISPILIVIGKKKDAFQKSSAQVYQNIKSLEVANYESLWDWCNLICYLRSSASSIDKENLKDVGLESSINIADLDDLDWVVGSNNATQATTMNFAQSDSLFSFAPVDLPINPQPHSSEEQVAQADEDAADISTESSDTIQANDNLDSDLIDKNIAQPKIAKSYGNIFDLSNLNKVIRYHSTSTMVESKSNIHQSDFAFYLNAKRLLNSLIHESYDQMTPLHGEHWDLLLKYLEAYNLDISVESFVGAHLRLGRPAEFANLFRPEHMDVIASSIIKFSSKESILVSDSLGMDVETVMLALFKFSSMNNKGVIYLAEDSSAIDRLILRFNDKSGPLGISDKTIMIVNSEADFSAAFESFNSDTLVIIPNSINHTSSLKKFNARVLPACDKFNLFMDIELDSRRYSLPLHTHLMKAPTLFRSTQEISPTTNIQTIQSLFSKAEYDRYFTPGFGDLDDMSCFLLKSALIENLSLFQRYEDLSNISMSDSRSKELWAGKHALLSQTFSSVINKIVLLSEDIYKGVNPQPVTIATIRNIAMQIFELCSFCISSIPLTYSIYEAVKSHSKPVVAIPKHIENIVFGIVESIGMPIEPIAKYNINNIVDLNTRITALEGLINSSDVVLAQNVELLRELSNHRVGALSNYFTILKTGSMSKYPDLTGLISAFYKYCSLGLNSKSENYDEISYKAKQIELEIGALVDLPICIIDFIKYELEQYQIKCGEISSRSFSLEFSESSNTWQPSHQSPRINLFDEENDAVATASQFNTGEYDVVFVEMDELSGVSLASEKVFGDIASDHMRKRILLLTYFNKDIQHYISLINAVNSTKQVVAPNLHMEIADTPAQKALSTLVKQQLGLYNINLDYDHDLDLSYYLTNPGKNLLIEYLELNPSYLAHHPQLHINSWDIYTVLGIANMASSATQIHILEHLAYFANCHKKYLRDSKSNPFDVFSIQPKAQFTAVSNDRELTYLNPKVGSVRVLSNPIKFASLSYIKSKNDCLTLDDCLRLHRSNALLDKTRLKGLLTQQFSDSFSEDKLDATHSQLLGRYIEHLTKYLIAIYRDKITNILQDRYRNWIFVDLNKTCKPAYLLNHFMGSYGLRVSTTLNGIYHELLMLGDLELVGQFEKSCEIISFLASYQLTLNNQEKEGKSTPILIPVSSPFNDKTASIREGVILRVNLPSSLMVSLSPKSYSITIAYPTKSKPIELNLAYILKHPEVLKNQNILASITPADQKLILGAYGKNKFSEIVKNKLSSIHHLRITGFTDVAHVASAAQHPTLISFSNPDKGRALRTMDVLYENLFESYYLLKNLIPLTMVNFLNDKGESKYGFVIPSDLELSSAQEHLLRITAISRVPMIYKYFKENLQGFKYLRSIVWVGEFGRMEVGGLASDKIELTCKGGEIQLQNLFMHKDLFAEDMVTNNLLQEGTPKSSRQKSPTIKLTLDSAVIQQRGNEYIYKFIISHNQLEEIVSFISSKKLYDLALIDCSHPTERLALGKKVNK